MGGNVASHQAGISILLPFPEECHTPTPLCPPFTTHTHTIFESKLTVLAFVILKNFETFESKRVSRVIYLYYE